MLSKKYKDKGKDKYKDKERYKSKGRDKDKDNDKRMLCTRSPTGHAVLVDCRFEFPSGEYEFAFVFECDLAVCMSVTLLLVCT